eukprot:29613-Pelagococcus_subviridis.AAC.4
MKHPLQLSLVLSQEVTHPGASHRVSVRVLARLADARRARQHALVDENPHGVARAQRGAALAEPALGARRRQRPRVRVGRHLRTRTHAQRAAGWGEERRLPARGEFHPGRERCAARRRRRRRGGCRARRVAAAATAALVGVVGRASAVEFAVVVAEGRRRELPGRRRRRRVRGEPPADDAHRRRRRRRRARDARAAAAERDAASRCRIPFSIHLEDVVVHRERERAERAEELVEREAASLDVAAADRRGLHDVIEDEVDGDAIVAVDDEPAVSREPQKLRPREVRVVILRPDARVVLEYRPQLVLEQRRRDVPDVAFRVVEVPPRARRGYFVRVDAAVPRAAVVVGVLEPIVRVTVRLRLDAVLWARDRVGEGGGARVGVGEIGQQVLHRPSPRLKPNETKRRFWRARAIDAELEWSTPDRSRGGEDSRRDAP